MGRRGRLIGILVFLLLRPEFEKLGQWLWIMVWIHMGELSVHFLRFCLHGFCVSLSL